MWAERLYSYLKLRDTKSSDLSKTRLNGDLKNNLWVIYQASITFQPYFGIILFLHNFDEYLIQGWQRDLKFFH